jgi:hypothetical protein
VTASRNPAASAGFLAVVVARLEGVEPPTHGSEVRSSSGSALTAPPNAVRTVLAVRSTVTTG